MNMQVERKIHESGVLRKTGDMLPIAPAWAGHPVGFALLTTETMQFAAFYDADRILTVVSRDLSSTEWQSISLPEQVGWDSHNSLVMACDRSGCLHLSGNMHTSPLVYFRSRKPGDIQSFERFEMTGIHEDLVTYPEFFTGPGDDLFYGYRYGSSGKGDQIYNRYNLHDRQWERLSIGAIVSGEGVRNAYLDGPHRGMDGMFHLCWVWRDTPDCATNHDVCYARSRDLVHWERSDGTPLSLPITSATAEVVDPVLPGYGLMNGNTKIGFDCEGRVTVSYHKLDSGGFTQIYNARREIDGWRIFQVTDWNGVWLPSGMGSIIFQLRVYPVVPGTDGRLTQRVWSATHGSLKWQIDPETLHALKELPSSSGAITLLSKPVLDGMRVNWISDCGSNRGAAPRFALRWESLPENRDQPQTDISPAPFLLQVVRFGVEDQASSC